MNVERVRQGISSDNSCKICGHDSEEILHVFRDCHVARDVWNELIPVQKQARFYSGSLYEWMTENLQSLLPFGLDGVSWACRFGMIFWRL